MNMVLLEDTDLGPEGQTARIDGRRFRHMLEIQGATLGDEIPVGVLNGLMGVGRVVGITQTELTLELSLQDPPPAPSLLEVIVALPRPLILKRLLHSLTTIGVKRIHLIGARKVERSFWNSRALAPEAVRDQLVLGLEQAKDTQLPEVALYPYFKPFTEEHLSDIQEGARSLLAHPGATVPCPRAVPDPVLLAVGPEGGFNDFEVERFLESGFETVSLGERIFRVDIAVTYAVAQLSP